MLTEFRPVPGYEGIYEINATGMVWSVERRVRHSEEWTKRVGGRFMRPRPDRRGYETVSLKQPGDLHPQPRYVHQLVALAFIGPRPAGLETCHNNGNKLDNRASNLRYDTAAGNARDRAKHGTNYLANRSSCIVGHPFSPGNTRIRVRPGGKERVCLACQDLSNARKAFSVGHARARDRLMLSAANIY